MCFGTLRALDHHVGAMAVGGAVVGRPVALDLPQRTAVLHFEVLLGALHQKGAVRRLTLSWK